MLKQTSGRDNKTIIHAVCKKNIGHWDLRTIGHRHLPDYDRPRCQGIAAD